MCEDLSKEELSIRVINTEIPEGKWLIAAMAMLTTESRTTQHPDECFRDVDILAKHIYGDQKPKEVTSEVY